MINKTITFKSGISVPALGFGTWEIEGETAINAVRMALEAGYRHIDTADAYSNHEAVGQGIKKSGLKREDFFLTTKVWRDFLYPAEVISSTERFLKELGTDFIDLLLIHWPNSRVPISETLNAFEDLKSRGLIRAIGISNFTEGHIKAALATGVTIDTNQVEIHPTWPQFELEQFCREKEIVLTAYSPLGRGEDLNSSTVTILAEKYSRTAAQIIINWLLKRGMIVIPKSEKEKRIIENFKAMDFELSGEDMEKMNKITPNNNRIINPPFAEF